MAGIKKTPGLKKPTFAGSMPARRTKLQQTEKSPLAKTTAKPTAKAKPMTPADRQAKAKRPAIGTDKSAAKQYGKKSWNNGYTN